MQDSATPDRNSPRSGDSMAHTQDELLAACLRAPRSEQERRLDEICARHPGIEDELREQFEVLVHVGLAGLASDEEKPDSPAGTGRRFGDFELLEVLAEGGMGVVHHARQVSLDREVIVKLIRPELMHFDATRERFTREAGAIAQLEHRGIVQVFASGEEDGVPYIAMERIDGVPLTRRIESDGAPAPSRTWVKESLDLAAQIADALHHAHARGILHRDVKPSNVLVSEAGQASLIDFGLHALDEETPSETERLTREGSAPGTLLYMAPEQLENGSFDVRSEVYALGATLYEMLTGEPPFRGPSRSATEQLIRRGGPTSLRRGRPAISTDVDAIVRKALSVDPTRRYVDCAAFAHDLRAALAQRPVSARPDGALYRLRCWARRQPALATMSAVAGLLSIAAPAAIIIQQRASARELQAAFDEERTARVAAEDMAGFVIDLVENADPNVQKPGAAVKQILSRGVERLDERLGPYPTRHAQVQKVLGRIHGSLGLFPEAHALLDESVATLESTHTDASQRHGVGDRRTREALGHLVESRGARARVRELSGDLAGAFEDRRSLEAELSVLWPDDPWRELYARAEWMRLSAYAPEGAFGSKAPPDDLAVLEAIRAAAEATEASTSAGESYRIATLGWLGSQLVRLGQVSTDRTQARAWTEEGRDSLRSALARVENSSEVGSLDHADMHNALGLALKRLGDAKGAEAHYLASLEILNERLSPDNQRLAVASVNMASFLNTQGKPAEAIEPMRQGYEILKNARGPEDPDVVGVFGSLAGVRYHAGDHEGLADMLTEVIALQAKVLSPRHRFLAASYERRGILRAKEGDVDAARADLHESLERYREFLAEDSAPCARVEGALASLQAAEEGADAADDR